MSEASKSCNQAVEHLSHLSSAWDGAGGCVHSRDAMAMEGEVILVFSSCNATRLLGSGTTVYAASSTSADSGSTSRKLAGPDESIYASCAEIVECERNFKRVRCFQAATKCSALPVKQIHPGIGCMRFARLSEADSA